MQVIVAKLSRLGRDAIDVSTTVAKLEEMGIRVYCLTLGGVDLTSSSQKARWILFPSATF